MYILTDLIKKKGFLKTPFYFNNKKQPLTQGLF